MKQAVPALIILSIALLQGHPQAPGLELSYTIDVTVFAQNSVVGFERVIFSYDASTGASRAVSVFARGVTLDPSDLAFMLERSALSGSPFEGEPATIIYTVPGSVVPYVCEADLSADVTMGLPGREDIVFRGKAWFDGSLPLPLLLRLEAESDYVRVRGAPQLVLEDVRIFVEARITLASEPFCGRPIAAETPIYFMLALSAAIFVGALYAYSKRHLLRIY